MIFVGATNGRILTISEEKKRFESLSRCNRKNAKKKKDYTLYIHMLTQSILKLLAIVL